MPWLVPEAGGTHGGLGTPRSCHHWGLTGKSVLKSGRSPPKPDGAHAMQGNQWKFIDAELSEEIPVLFKL